MYIFQTDKKINLILYKREFEITDKFSFIKAVSYDYVCAKYKNNECGNANFICSDCIAMDIDNDHSDLTIHDNGLQQKKLLKFSTMLNLLYTTAEII